MLNYLTVGVSLVSSFFDFISYVTKNKVLSKKINSAERLNYSLYTRRL